MLSVGSDARRFSPSENICVKKANPHCLGNIHYRQRLLGNVYYRPAFSLSRQSELVMGRRMLSSKIVFLLSRMHPVIKSCEGAAAIA
jgi:hypothetical protein